ncbi:hypothetical protein B4113_3008 [Geobacillus sp. B4113_201601]|nr:hypothetical protein B4113_3008 [Geobacillus sp. B4113_201601]
MASAAGNGPQGGVRRALLFIWLPRFSKHGQAAALLGFSASLFVPLGMMRHETKRLLGACR